MNQAFVTVIVPFSAARAAAVDLKLDALGNPARPDVVQGLHKPAYVHFMSMVVVPALEGQGLAHLVIEVCADGHPRAALARLAKRIPGTLSAALEAAGLAPERERLGAFLEAHRREFGIGWPRNAGVAFAGTPGMSVERIHAEKRLAERIRELLDRDRTPRPALEKLNGVREEIFRDAKLKWAFLSEPVPLLGEAKPLSDAVWPLLKAAFRDFLWPLLLPPVAVLLYSRLVWGSGLAMALWHVALAVMAELLAAGAFVFAGHRILRRQEEADTPSDEEPSMEHMSAILEREDPKGVVQNHLAGVSILKPRWVRRVTLRLAFWLIGEFEARRSPPGILNRIGSIHFARWFCVPGTGKLVFLSNYDGSWQSYLEDFIARLREGLSTVWSNTLDFPKTANLFQGGAGDSTRFKRWARRQQLPTRFWYSAYPELTTGRIRTNAAIRHGFASARSESEAARWLTRFGYPLPETLDAQEIPTLAFRGLANLRFSHCLLVRLSDGPKKARAWLKLIEDDLSYGENPAGAPQADEMYVKAMLEHRDHALVAAFTCTGLRALLDPGDPGLANFPIPFQQGMAERARALGDQGDDAPEKWAWGGTDENRADVLLMLYAKTRQELRDQIDLRRKQLKELGYEPREVGLAELPERDKITNQRHVIEPFGFRDGISQPIMRGSMRWSKAENATHSVEPGELVLGYRDNLGTTAPLLQCKGRDIGRNGSFLVVRQLEQHKDEFDRYAAAAADALADDPRVPKLSRAELAEWIKAKMVGRWKDGTSLVKHPEKPGSQDDALRAPDNTFMFGREDRDGLRCPLGAHIRRANPRDSFEPGSPVQLGITNRHRILRVGRIYEPAQGAEPGLLFMCVNADIERQFEFLQQTWLLGPDFDGLHNEIDPVVGHGGDNHTMTIPTPGGPLRLPRLNKFVKVRGGGYFFMPGKSAVRALAG